MLDDALEESFNDILEAETDSAPASQLVFSADDFMPQTSTLAPPREKPPPLPERPPRQYQRHSEPALYSSPRVST